MRALKFTCFVVMTRLFPSILDLCPCPRIRLSFHFRVSVQLFNVFVDSSVSGSIPCWDLELFGWPDPGFGGTKRKPIIFPIYAMPRRMCIHSFSLCISPRPPSCKVGSNPAAFT